MATTMGRCLVGTYPIHTLPTNVKFTRILMGTRGRNL